MENVNPLKETLIHGTLNVGLPTFDMYSDIALTIKLYTTPTTTTHWTQYDNGTWSNSTTTSYGHPIYATCIFIPFLINYVLGWRAWYYDIMKKSCNRKKYTWIFALLGCYPQLVALWIIYLFWTQAARGMKKKKHLERNVMGNEVFTEAVPTTYIMTLLIVVFQEKGIPAGNQRVLLEDEREDSMKMYLFYASFASSALSAGLGLAKCLKVRSYPTQLWASFW